LKAGDEIIQIGDVVLADFKEDFPAFKGAKNTKIDINIRQGKPVTQIVLDVEIKSVPLCKNRRKQACFVPF
jgi:carboxyl-terminal processing protease